MIVRGRKHHCCLCSPSMPIFLASSLLAIDKNRKLESDVRNHEKKTSIAYPAAYGYSKELLKRRCVEYNEALTKTKSIVKRNCIRRYAPYSNVSIDSLVYRLKCLLRKYRFNKQGKGIASQPTEGISVRG